MTRSFITAICMFCGREMYKKLAVEGIAIKSGDTITKGACPVCAELWRIKKFAKASVSKEEIEQAIKDAKGKLKADTIEFESRKEKGKMLELTQLEQEEMLAGRTKLLTEDEEAFIEGLAVGYLEFLKEEKEEIAPGPGIPLR